MTRLGRLTELVQSLEEKPVEWGVDDCNMTPHRWVVDETGYDVYSAEYGSEEEAREIIEQSGGVEAIWRNALTGVLFENFSEPKCGDVAIIKTRAFGVVGVIFVSGGHALWRTENGTKYLTPRPDTIIACWSVPDNQSQ